MKDFIRLKRKTLNILMSYKGNISGQIKLKLTALNENIQPKKKNYVHQQIKPSVGYSFANFYENL